jgi:hypothetical protein
MDAIAGVFRSFNRYWLRYGPNTAVTTMILLYFFPRLRDIFEGGSLNGLTLILLAAGIQYVFTLPVLLAHMARLPGQDARAYARLRSEIKLRYQLVEAGKTQNELPSYSCYPKDCPVANLYDQETLETFAHQREHGNSFYCCGFTYLILVPIAALITQQNDVLHKPVFVCIAVMAAFCMTFGGAAWVVATNIELQTMTGAQTKSRDLYDYPETYLIAAGIAAIAFYMIVSNLR